MRDEDWDSESRLPGLRGGLSGVAEHAPSRRTVLALLGAGVTGGVVSNPGVATDLLRMAATLDREAVTPLDLVPTEDATHTAIEDGRWGEPSTWESGEVPGDDAQVLVPEDRTVTLSTESCEIGRAHV